MSFDEVYVERTEVVRAFSNIRCDNCRQAVTLVTLSRDMPPGVSAGEYGQDVLIIEFHGGYEGYIDCCEGIDCRAAGHYNRSSSVGSLQLCHSCADDLRRAHPFIDSLLTHFNGPLKD